MGAGADESSSVLRKHNPRRLTTDQEIIALEPHPRSTPWSLGGTGEMSEVASPPPSHTKGKGGLWKLQTELSLTPLWRQQNTWRIQRGSGGHWKLPA